MDADSDLFGLDWGNDPIATINSVTERNDKNSWWEAVAGICRFWRSRQSVSHVSVYRVSTGGDLQVAERRLVSKDQTGRTPSTMTAALFESGQALGAI